MVPYTILLVSPLAELRHTIEKALMDMPVEVASARSGEEARQSILETKPQIAIVSDTLNHDECFILCEILRKVHRREPFQIILAVTDVHEDLLERALNGVIDDFYITSDPMAALKLRVQAAIRRINDHETVSGEREYYRRAARQEEELTSKALDETLALREMVEASQQSPRIDPVTGLLRESAMLEEVDTEVERAVRSLNTVSGFIVSVDQSDTLRNTHGAEAMNRLMAQFGRAFQHGLRKYDLAGQYGKEGILVALPGTDLLLGEDVAGRFAGVLRRLVSQSSVFSESVTLSFGVAVFSDGETREQWLNRASASLARAQSLGGGRVETEEDPPNAYAVWKAARGD
ncbi:MAG: diguanylate cyclase [Spirochaetales bacterium]|nr:diguanylate cyclase [Spirochaetales bacterium]